MKQSSSYPNLKDISNSFMDKCGGNTVSTTLNCEFKEETSQSESPANGVRMSCEVKTPLPYRV